MSINVDDQQDARAEREYAHGESREEANAREHQEQQLQDALSQNAISRQSFLESIQWLHKETDAAYRDRWVSSYVGEHLKTAEDRSELVEGYKEELEELAKDKDVRVADDVKKLINNTAYFALDKDHDRRRLIDDVKREAVKVRQEKDQWKKAVDSLKAEGGNIAASSMKEWITWFKTASRAEKNEASKPGGTVDRYIKSHRPIAKKREDLQQKHGDALRQIMKFGKAGLKEDAKLVVNNREGFLGDMNEEKRMQILSALETEAKRIESAERTIGSAKRRLNGAVGKYVPKRAAHKALAYLEDATIPAGERILRTDAYLDRREKLMQDRDRILQRQEGVKAIRDGGNQQLQEDLKQLEDLNVFMEQMYVEKRELIISRLDRASQEAKPVDVAADLTGAAALAVIDEKNEDKAEAKKREIESLKQTMEQVHPNMQPLVAGCLEQGDGQTLKALCNLSKHRSHNKNRARIDQEDITELRGEGMEKTQEMRQQEITNAQEAAARQQIEQQRAAQRQAAEQQQIIDQQQRESVQQVEPLQEPRVISMDQFENDEQAAASVDQAMQIEPVEFQQPEKKNMDMTAMTGAETKQHLQDFKNQDEGIVLQLDANNRSQVSSFVNSIKGKGDFEGREHCMVMLNDVQEGTQDFFGRVTARQLPDQIQRLKQLGMSQQEISKVMAA